MRLSIEKEEPIMDMTQKDYDRLSRPAQQATGEQPPPITDPEDLRDMLRSRGLARLDAQGLAELRDVLFDVLDRRKWQISESDDVSFDFATEERWQLVEAITAAIVQRAAPAVSTAIRYLPVFWPDNGVCRNCGRTQREHTPDFSYCYEGYAAPAVGKGGTRR